MNALRTDGIILARTNFGEADRILKVLTPRDGVMSVMAKSVRKEGAKLAGKIELFAVCDLNLHIGRSSLSTLTGAKIKQFFSQILVEYDRLQFGYDVLKSINKSVETIAEQEFYNLLLSTLQSLDDLEIPLSLCQVWFYLHLANILGLGLNTATDVNGMKLVEGGNYDFDAYDQVFIFNNSGQYTTEHIKFLRVLAQNQLDVVCKIKGAAVLADDCLAIALAVAKI
ncbi:DNA repair protein RecO [Candidatus Saccharibacteria bacterium]|nr:DNA repair protein RecO [Candidatus Saccharibacteria bacterium]